MKTDVNDIDVHVKGELYNIDSSDLPQYYADGNPFSEIEGDFYIKITDRNKKRVLHISDFGGTHSSEFMQRNTIMTLDLEGNPISVDETYLSERYTFKGGKEPVIRKDPTHFFDALDRAIKIRQEKNCILALSDGHDSGTIASGLIRNKLSCSVVSSLESEDINIIKKRISMIKKHDNIAQFIETPKDKKQVDNKITEIERELKVSRYEAYCCLSHYMLAEMTPNTVLLSGLGADELYVNKYDKLLREFMRDAQRAYKHFNVRARFPLLDYNVYSEYYNLHPKLQRGYKRPLEEYINTTDLPHQTQEKHSFVVGQNLI